MKRGMTLITTIILALFAAFLPGLADSARAGIADAPAQARAQTGVSWSAQYYNNEGLDGTPVLTRTEGGTSFNWGAGSPDTSVGIDHFSVRMATDVWFEAGTYRFFILADDSVKLWIDYPPDQRPTINTYDAPTPGVMLSGDVTLSAGFHHIQIDYREMTGDAYLFVSWANVATNPSPNFPTAVPVPSAYWTAQYYNNPTLSGGPVITQTENNPTHNWGYDAPASGIPADNFSARWTTMQTVNSGGSYTFSALADDGVRLIVDGVIVINEFHGATGQLYSATMNLNAGLHSIVLEYYDATGIAALTYNLTQASAPQQQPSYTGATAVVNAAHLNLRSGPSAAYRIIGVIHRGEQYQITGRNAAGTWWQMNANGKVGWANGSYLTLYNTENVPAADGSTTVIPTSTPLPSGNQCPGFAVSRLVVGGRGMVLPGQSNNLRSQPSSGSTWMGLIPAGGVSDILSGPVCGENGAWWQVRYGGVTGWTMEGQYGTYWLAPY